MLEYRKDFRSLQQFKEDIKVASLTERGLMSLYVAYLNRDGDMYYFEDNGVDNRGNLIEGKVDCRSDFILKHPDHPDVNIDVKFSRKDNKYFHFKVNQVKSYIRDNVSVVNFMGVHTGNVRFSYHTPESLVNDLTTKDIVFFKPWGNKECIRYVSGSTDWTII